MAIMKPFLLLVTLLFLPLTQALSLKIGVMPNNPPLSTLIDKKNHFSGFEISLMQEICLRIKEPCSFKAVIMKQIQPALMEQKIDLAIATYIIADKPPPGFIYSIPYLASNAQFIVNDDSKIISTSSIQGKNVGVRHGTLFDDVLNKLFGDKITITKYMTIDELVSALKNENIDAVLTDAVAADYWVLNSGGLYRSVGKKIPIGNGYGILANVGQETLIGRINQAIQNMMIDGSYVKIYSDYFS